MKPRILIPIFLLSLAAGAAWVRDPSRAGERDRVAAFVRTGYAF